MADDELQEQISRLIRIKSRSGQIGLSDLIKEMAKLALWHWDPLERAKRSEARLLKTNTGLRDVSSLTSLPVDQGSGVALEAEMQKSKSRSHSQSRSETKSDLEVLSHLAGCQMGNPAAESLVDLRQTQSLAPAPARVDHKTNASHAARVRVQESRYIHATIKHYVRLRDKNRCVNCGSNQNLEFDHIVPFAKGGKHDAENIRLLCRACNQRHAMNAYGQTMNRYLRAPTDVYCA